MRCVWQHHDLENNSGSRMFGTQRKDGMRLAMLFAFLLVACAHSPNWQKDGATQVQSRQDAKLCEYESLKIVEKEDPHIRSTHGQEMDKSCGVRIDSQAGTGI